MPFEIVKWESFLYGKQQRYRALEVLCPVRTVGKVTREKTPTPLPLKFSNGNGEDFRIEHTDGGHLVGLAIGGPDESQNVVPMYCGFNRYAWKLKVENEIKDLCKQTKDLNVRVKVKYDSKDPRILAAFSVTVETEDGEQVHKFPDMPHTAPIELKDTIKPKDKKTFEEMLVEMKSQDWKLAGFKAAKEIGLKLPDTPGPYAVLDYMLFVKEYFSDVTTVQNGFAFSPRQRELILLINPTIHGKSTVQSDDPLDEYQTLTDFGDSGAEIDHIIPEGKAGSNAFSNARVVSSKCNKGKSDSVGEKTGGKSERLGKEKAKAARSQPY